METAIRQIAECGVALGHQVSCWVSQEPFKPSKVEQIFGVRVHRFKTFGSFLSAPLSFGHFFSRRNRPDILHLHLPHPLAELYTLFGKPRAKALIPYFHAFPVNQGVLGRLWFHWITRPILKNSKVILVSSLEMKSLVPELQEFSEKLVVLPFSVPCASDEQVTSWNKVRESKKIILSVGRMVSYKGYSHLLRAWKEVLNNTAELENWQLVLVGDGPEAESLKKWSSKNLNPKNITFVGATSNDEKNQFYREAAFYVMSSISTAETFGISLLEAFAFGLPAVVGDLPGGVSVLSRKGACGKIYPPADTGKLAAALLEMMRSQNLRCERGNANLAFARNHFAEQSAQEKYAEVINDK